MYKFIQAKGIDELEKEMNNMTSIGLWKPRGHTIVKGDFFIQCMERIKYQWKEATVRVNMSDEVDWSNLPPKNEHILFSYDGKVHCGYRIHPTFKGPWPELYDKVYNEHYRVNTNFIWTYVYQDSILERPELTSYEKKGEDDG